MVAFKERRLGVELRSATKPEPRDSGRMRARALDRGASTATTPSRLSRASGPPFAHYHSSGRSLRRKAGKRRRNKELKQIAHSQLSFERVNGKILDDRNAELGRNHCMLGRLPADHEVERQKQSARLVPHRRPIVQSNVRAWVKRDE